MADLLVHKYGGTSLADIGRIRAAAKRVARARANGAKVVVVVSAVGGETDRLLELARAANPALEPAREIDAALASGEQASAGLFALALGAQGVAARSFTGAQAGIRTDSAHGKARIAAIDGGALRACINKGIVAVVAGFQGATDGGDITTLGRGGSDTTAVALAAALGARECLIFTDVDGVYTTDPQIVPGARRLEAITFEEMLELASLGARVLQSRAVEFAGKYRVPLRVLSSLRDDCAGTLITYEEDGKMEKPEVSGVAFNRDEAKITISDVPDRPGVARAIFGAVADAGVDVDMIIQNVGADAKTSLSFTVHRDEFKRALAAVRAAAENIGAGGVAGAADIAKVAIVGIGMKSNIGVARKMFDALAAENINIQMISTSEIKVAVIIDEKYLELAVRALHKAFALSAPLRPAAQKPARKKAPKRRR
jgi:aspartate kinase